MRVAVTAWGPAPRAPRAVRVLGGRAAVLAAVVVTLLIPAVGSAGCTCGRKPDKTLSLARKVQVGPFTVTFVKLELFGDKAILTWSAPKAMPKAKGSPRNFEFATGKDSFLVATDGLEFGTTEEPEVDRSKDILEGRVVFDAQGLDPGKLAKIEIDGARWVIATSGDVVVQPDRKINFALSEAPGVEFTLDTPEVGGGRVRLTALPTDKPYRRKGAVIGSTARVEGEDPKAPSGVEIDDQRQVFAFRFDKLPLIWRVTAVRLDNPGPWVVDLRKSVQPKKTDKKADRKTGDQDRDKKR